MKAYETHNYLEPRHDLCFDRKLDHVLGGWYSKKEVNQVPGIYIYMYIGLVISQAKPLPEPAEPAPEPKVRGAA